MARDYPKEFEPIVAKARSLGKPMRVAVAPPIPKTYSAEFSRRRTTGS